MSAVAIVVDGETRQIMTSAATVGDALTEAGVTSTPVDEVEPSRDTLIPAPNASTKPFVITVIRVTETTEVIPENIPFQRRIVRSAEMSPDDPARILQTGVAGLQEISVRIVFRDGLEVERRPTATTVIEPPQDEIVMIGVSSESDAMPIGGRLAYINDGRAIVLEGSTDSPRQLSIEGQLDGRVFQLSPDGRYLLFTTTIEAEEADDESFSNELWVLATAEGETARPLRIENVLWAGWDPAATETPQIAYTTARSVSLPPGWEANNDLWLLELTLDESQPAPVRLIETYPAAYGWWGGNYAWSPTGGRLGYAFADEVGLLDMPSVSAEDATGFAVAPEPVRTVLHSFTPFDTGADWAWVPILSWSADGRFLAFSDHVGDELSSERFDLWLADTTAANKVALVEGAGIWSAAQWSPPTVLPESRLATLRATDPAASLESGYALWLADGDGSNAQRIFPPEGESGLFARSNQPLVWGPDEDKLAFIFDEALHVLDIPTGDIFRAGFDDTISSRPTWAPYGAADVR